MSFKPKLLPTIFTIPAVIILLILGSWQLKRLGEKNNLVNHVNQMANLPASDLQNGVPDIKTHEYKIFKLKGEFKNSSEMYLFTGARELNGTVGYNIITVFKLENGDEILVDRGWVPTAKKKPETRPETILTGKTQLLAMLHKGEKKHFFTPQNDIKNNLWFFIDVKAMNNKSKNDVYFRAIKTDDSLPIGGDKTIQLRNDHLQYSIIWFSFALILIVIYVIYHKNQFKNTVNT